jgi:hypothetical protein
MAARKRASGRAAPEPQKSEPIGEKAKRRTRKKLVPSPPVAAALYPLLTPAGEPVSVVHFAAELAPFARTGGLGEAVANLALYQVRSGMKTSVIMPLYRQVHDVVKDFVPVGDPFTLVVGPRQEYARLFESASLRDRAKEGKPRVYFIDNKQYFDREGIYGDKYGDYGDNARRWSFFALAALTALPQVSEAPVMLHAHDWHAALAPAYLRAYDSGRPFYKKTWSTLTVHNAGYQGHFPTNTMPDIGLPWDFYNHHMFEWHGRVNLLKGDGLRRHRDDRESHARPRAADRGRRIRAPRPLHRDARALRRHPQRHRQHGLGSVDRSVHRGELLPDVAGQQAQVQGRAAEHLWPAAAARHAHHRDERPHGGAEGPRPDPREPRVSVAGCAVHLPRAG